MRKISKCKLCEKETRNKIFCSLRCSALSKKKKEKKRYYCASCNDEFKQPRSGGIKKCKKCRDASNKNIVDWSTRDLQWLKDKVKDINQYHARMRSLARAYYIKNNKDIVCVKCGYDKHYNVCHIRAIKDFPMDTPISVVNSIDNLMALCPNCHWEFDNKDKIINIKKHNHCICGKNIGKKSKRCRSCVNNSKDKINWPSKEELEKIIWELSTVEIAKTLGVTDKAVEKRCKKYGIDKPPRGYWTKQKFMPTIPSGLGMRLQNVLK